MISMSVITPVMAALVAGLGENVGRLISAMAIKLRKILEPKIHSITIRSTMTYSEKCAFWTTDPEESQNTHLIRSILEYMVKNSIYPDEMRCNLGTGNQLKSDSGDFMRSRVIEFVPKEKVTHGDFTFEYTHQTQSRSASSPEKRVNEMSISSKKSSKEIEAFIRECYAAYVDEHYRIDDKTQYYYKQVPSKDGIRFKKYPIGNKTTFETIHFPEKTKVLDLVEKLSAGELNKLSLLLHGVPGCGKTSIIKALAKRLGFSIIEIKLSFMMNDAALMDVFHNKTIMYHQHNDEKFPLQTGFVPLNQRIYIFEDVDAECDVIHQRKDVPEKHEIIIPSDVKEPGEITEDSCYKMMMRQYLKQGLTLSGILNVFDGVLELNGAVIIMTTNHPGKLDEAFKRPGRITMSIEMKKMLAVDANNLVKARYGQKLDNIHDYVFTPALLESYCQTSANISELRSMVDEYQR